MAPDKTIGRWIGDRLAWLAAFVAFVGTTILIVEQLADTGGVADSTTLGLLIVAIALLFAVAAPRPTSGALKRITTFKVAGIEVGLGEIKLAERVDALQVQVENDGVNVRERQGDGYDEIVGVLKGRLQFVWKLLSFGSTGMRESNYISTSERLRTEKLLTYDEESFVRELLRGSQAELDDWSPSSRARFLDTAWAFAIRLGALIWDRRVRQDLVDQGWEVFDYKQDPGHRPDFLAHRDGNWVLIAARSGIDRGQPEALDVAARRLAGFDRSIEISRRWIVVPDISEGFLSNNWRELLASPSLPEVEIVHLGACKAP
jgi:hypothetical protein